MPPAAAPEHYLVYGLALRSSIAIEGLEALPFDSSRVIDCDVLRGEVSSLGARASLLPRDPLDEDGEATVTVEQSREESDTFVFTYRDETRFRIEGGGRRITAAWTPPATAADMATYLLGPVLAFVLRLRGSLVLHASAVECGARALLLCGASGAGKSTTAATLLQAGANAITDDVAAIVWRGGVPHVEPGYPRVRLWSDSAAGLYGDAEALPRLSETWEKRFVDARGRFVRDAVPIGAIAVLAGREPGPPRIRRLTGHEAAMALLVRTSAVHLADEAAQRTELSRIATLVAAVPVFEVILPDDLAATKTAASALQELLS
ncbi:MAG TPA: hypothetical protein VE010_16705 [Thermoanaerobaculia bacterium]|nr:hypothetical protein [Thermoanaerobaculia bacterium]